MRMQIGARLFDGPGPFIMGIVNATPDSFSDGGRYLDPERAVAHALRLADEGADLIDVGGESTRPGAQPVSAEDEIARVVPVIEALAKQVTVPISVDTSKPEVMRAAIAVAVSPRQRNSALVSPTVRNESAAPELCRST